MKLIINFIILLCLFFSNQILAQKNDLTRLNITSKQNETINLSDISKDTHHVILKSPEDKYPNRIFETYVSEDVILIANSENINDTFSENLNIYNYQGEFVKQIKESHNFTLDEKDKRIYSLRKPNIINVYSYEGIKLKRITLDVKVKNFQFFDKKLFISVAEINHNKFYQYKLFSIDLDNDVKELIHEFTYEDNVPENQMNIGSLSNFWLNGSLYWAHGLGSHFYEMNKNNGIKQIEISYPENRTYMDQILTIYGMVGNYLYCSFQINFNNSIYLKDLKNGDELMIEYFNNDDIYKTGKFGFKSTINNKLYFTKKTHEVPEPARTNLNLSGNDILLVYTL